MSKQSPNPDAPRRFDPRDSVRKGAPSSLRRDLYFHFMEGSWMRVFVVIGVGFLLLNLIFAGLFLAAGGVTGLESGTFLDAFAFSVQTMTTIGYGAMSPTGSVAHVLVTLEAIVGLTVAAMATGLVFAKATRPQSSVLFSERVVVTQHHGKPTLMFRVGNARGNDVLEATMRVSVLMDDVSPEGYRMRRVFDLDLVRSRQPMFVLSWQLMHVIDESSPLFGVTPEDLPARVFNIVATLTGYDATYAQTTHARHIYYPEDVHFGHRLVDVIGRTDDGRVLLDYTHFHDVTPEDATQA
jgi:inward rectifier potassium channel